MGDEWEWDKYGKRVWPSAEELDHPSIPGIIAKDLRDAKKCFDAGVFSATVVMCGRALEGIVQEKCDEINLSKGLAKLKKSRLLMTGFMSGRNCYERKGISVLTQTKKM